MAMRMIDQFLSQALRQTPMLNLPISDRKIRRTNENCHLNLEGAQCGSEDGESIKSAAHMMR
eukprot:scaffold209734_cov16-Tisochrysis_lutea.AAC.1